MRRITIDKCLKLEINGCERVLKFSLGVMRDMGFDDLREMLQRLNTAADIFRAALFVLNDAIKTYNREFNGNIMPITYSEIADILKSTEDIKRLETNMRALCFAALPIKEEKLNEWTEDEGGRQIEPTVGRLIVMGLTVLRLSFVELCGMTAAELSAMLDDYGYINGTEKAVQKHPGKVEGVGDAGILMRS